MFQYLDCYTVSFAATGLRDELHSAQRERDRGTVYARFEVMSVHAWCDRSVTDLLFTTRRNGVKCVKYILYEAALRGPAGGECVFL